MAPLLQTGVAGGFDEEPDLARSVELFLQAQTGDLEALNALFDRYRPRLLRIVRARMGAVLLRRLEPDDVVQEVFTAALGGLGAFRLESHAGILRWLVRIAENRIRDAAAFHQAQRRDARRERELSARSASEERPDFEPPDPGPSPSQALARAEFEAILDAHVHALQPPDFREVILLRDYFGADWEAVRAELGRPTVRACEELHRRAHVKLRQSLRPWLRGMDG